MGDLKIVPKITPIQAIITPVEIEVRLFYIPWFIVLGEVMKVSLTEIDSKSNESLFSPESNYLFSCIITGPNIGLWLREQQKFKLEIKKNFLPKISLLSSLSAASTD